MGATETRCECCWLPESMCGKAAERKQQDEAIAERTRLSKLPGAILAGYPGWCSQCGEHYSAGTPIVHDHSKGWRSLECCEVTR